MDRYPMTKHGAELLEEELRKLKMEDRPRIIKAIAEARAHGDLRENAEYHAAKELQSFNEGRIHEIEGKLGHAQIIDLGNIPNEGKVIFGATVHLVNVETQEEIRYSIVGEDEADIRQGKLSYTSPSARALIGKFEGDEVTVNAPNGMIVYEIIRVEY